MKILMLVPFLPNTYMSGGQTRWYNIIKYLSKNHEITLFSLIKDESERRFIPELEVYCKKVNVFTRPKSPWTIRNILLTAFTYYPLLVIRNWSFQEKQAIKEELAKEKYDLVHAETFYVMPHLPDTKIPTILVEQTIEYLVYKHYVDNEVPIYLKPLFMLDVLKLRFWEKHFWRKASCLVAVSDDDRKIMQKEIKNIEVEIIPNGIDSTHFAAKPLIEPNEPRVLYVGNFKWLQNVEAVDLLINHVWRLIRKKVKNAKLWVVGRSIPKHIVELSKTRDDIIISEAIPDIREAYKNASVMLVPIKGPGGTRLKVLEAMASSLPVVSTPIGVAGLDIKPSVHALVSDSYKGLAQEAVRVINDKKLANKIGENGKKFVKSRYDWKIIVELHDKIYNRVLS